jgi:glutathione S-transferase
MRILYHLWLSPFSRKARIVLAEKKLDFHLKAENVWERREEFLRLNPAGTVPVLVDETGTVVSDSTAICEYLEEMVPDPPLIPGDAAARAEVRRLVAWFDGKFDREVTQNLVGEKMMKRFLGLGQPDSGAIRVGAQNLHIHMAYIGWLSERRRYLAGDAFSLADIAAASHLSAVDYLGDVPWEDHPTAKEWYARVKSRPSLRPILADYIAGAPPPPHYADLDF